MIQAIIFDMDGVLIDSEPLHKMTERAVMERHGVTLTEDDFISSMGRTMQVTFQEWIRKYGLDVAPRQLSNEKDHIFNPLLRTDIQLMPGALELLNRLKKAGIRLALASSSSREKIDIVLDRFALHDFFLATVAGNEITNGKPDPEIFLKAARLLEILPQHSCVVEDAAVGVTAAKAAGMACIGFRSGHTMTQELSRADDIATSLDQIASFIDL